MSTAPTSPIIAARALDIDALPRGRTSRVLIEIVSDALGRAVQVPIMVARGNKPGPTVGVTAAVHGNELNGIPVIHRLFQSLEGKPLRGTVVGVVATNVPGLHAQRREYIDGTDLNDVFPGSPKGNVSMTYAYRLLERVIARFDYLLDLHTASFGRINSLYVRADMRHEATARMAYLQKPQIILHNPASDGTLRDAAMDRGIPAITVEIADPHQFQPRYIRPAVAGVQAVLADLGLIRRRPPRTNPAPILCERSYWIYTDRGGLLDVLPELAQRVERDEVIARVRDPFGDIRAEYRAPEAGVVIGKSTNPVGPTGARVLHLGIPSEPPMSTELVASPSPTPTP